MKILHTSDWHLGVKTNGIDRLNEQRKVLEEILSIANFENIDCVIIAGDVFNSSNPSAEAEELFFDTIEKLSANGDRFVFVLAGNHDDPTRIEAGIPLASKHNIALVGDLPKLKLYTFNQNSLVKVIETGKGYIKIQKNDETVTIGYLPYPSESRIKEKVDSDLDYNEKVKFWANFGSSAFSEETLNIFVSHLFMVGSKTKDSEVKVGDLLAVTKSSLPNADYVALGHIHTPQHLGDNFYYSGAITALSAGQKELGVNVITTEKNVIKNIEKIKLNNIAKFEKETISSLDDAESVLSKYDDHDIVELEIIQTEPLSSSLLKQLKKEYPCISSISLIRNSLTQSESISVKRKVLNDIDLFKNFYKDIRGFDASDDLIQMFNLCKGDNNETT